VWHEVKFTEEDGTLLASVTLFLIEKIGQDLLLTLSVNKAGEEVILI